MSRVRAIPTSRAYWELRAEQVLNRVFAPEAPIELEVCDTPAPASIAAGSAQPHQPPGPTNRSRRAQPAGQAAAGRFNRLQQQPSLVVLTAGVLVTLTAAVTLLGLNLWQQSQQALRQERNLLLVERLRSLGPASTTDAGDGEQASGAESAAAASDSALPPPPLEPWMEELATLPASSAPPARVLRVPMNDRVSSPAPAATGAGPGPGSPAAASEPPVQGLPQLVGVVEVPGRPGSAIFQVDGSSSSAAAGEAIGSSGWRLQSASGDTAVIERNGVQRRISISSGF